MIKDTITGHTYEGNRKICRLLNDLYDGSDNDKLTKQLYRLHEENFEKDTHLQALADIEAICVKYNIKLSDVAETLEEYILLDNGDEL